MSKLGSTKKRIACTEIGNNARLLRSYSDLQRKAELTKNGLTVEDIEKAAEGGFRQGYGAATEKVMKSSYAGMAITLSERGWTDDDIIELLRAVDEKVINCIVEDDLVDEALEKVGIRIVFDNPFNRVQEGT